MSCRCIVSSTDLELPSKIIHVAAIFIVDSRILPNSCNFFLKGIPTLEVTNMCWWLSSMLTTNPFPYTCERQGLLNHLVIIDKTARWKIDKREEDLESPGEVSVCANLTGP